MLIRPKTRVISVLCFAAVITSLALGFVPTASSSDIGPKSPGPGITLTSIPIDPSAGDTDNAAEYTIRVTSEADVTETVTLSINESSSGYNVLREYSFSENNFDLAVGETKNVTLTLTIIYGTTPGNYTIKVDGYATWLDWLPPDYACTVCYVEVSSTVTPSPAPRALPEFNMMGLLALIGMLSVVLARGMRKRE